VGFGTAVLLMMLVMAYGNRPSCREFLFVAVTALVILRRATPVPFKMINLGGRTMFLAVIMFINIARVFGEPQSSGGNWVTSDDSLYAGAFLMLAGAMISVGRWAIQIRD